MNKWEKARRRAERRRRRQIIGIGLIFSFCIFLGCVIHSDASAKTKDKGGYWVQGNVFIKEYERRNCTYIGNDSFLDQDGNEWIYTDCQCKEGNQYTLLMHNNGTESIYDDVIEGIK